MVLFAKAREDQIDLIRSGLDCFAQGSGQKINYAKSNVHFSKNVSEEEEATLSTRLGIPRTRSLGKYLGFNMGHQGRSRETHLELLQRIKGKLAGWKGNAFPRWGESRW